MTNPGVRDRDDARVRGHGADVRRDRAPAPDDERVRACLRAELGLDVGRLELVSAHGDRRSWRAGTAAGAYRVRWSRQSSAGARVALALARTSPGRGDAAHGLPRPASVAVPVLARDGATSVELDGGRLSAEPWLVGATGRETTLTPPQWTALGRLLARVHALEPVRGLPRTAFDPGAALDAVARADASVTAALGALPDVVSCAAAEAWAGARHRVGLVRDRAVHVGARLAEHGRDAPFVVCHADVHLGHVVVTGPRDVALVSWERAALAPPEQDLVVVLGGALTDGPVSAEQAAAFFTGYGRIDIDAERLAYALCVRALLAAARAACTALDALAGPAERARGLTDLVAAVSPAGAVDAALD